MYMNITNIMLVSSARHVCADDDDGRAIIRRGGAAQPIKRVFEVMFGCTV